MILKKVSNISNRIVETIDEFSSLFSEVRKLEPKFNNILDASIKQILNCYSKDLGVDKHDVKAQDLIDFVNDSDSLGSFIFDFSDMLSCLSIIDIGRQDEKFVKALFEYAKKTHIIKDDGTDLDTGEKLDYDKLAKIIIMDMNSTNDRFDSKLFEDTMKGLANTYRSITESIVEVKKDVDENVNLTEDETNDSDVENKLPELKTPETEITDTDSEGENSNDVDNSTENVLQDITPEEETLMTNETKPEKNNANVDLLAPVQTLIDSQWTTIADVNNLILQIEQLYTGDSKEQVVQILKEMLDEYTINVGMLHKVIELTNPLISSGAEKASEIVQ